MSKIVRNTAEAVLVSQNARRGGLRLVVTDAVGRNHSFQLDPSQALDVLLAGYGAGDTR